MTFPESTKEALAVAGERHGSELETVAFPDVITGEMLLATPENVARVLLAAREMKRRVNDVVLAATEWVAEESRRLGTKTIVAGGERIVLSGGERVVYDAHLLAESLREAGCPEERVDAAVVAEVTYKVDRGVLKQLAAANPVYAAAIVRAASTEPESLRVSVRPR